MDTIQRTGKLKKRGEVVMAKHTVRFTVAHTHTVPASEIVTYSLRTGEIVAREPTPAYEQHYAEGQCVTFSNKKWALAFVKAHAGACEYVGKL